MDGSSKDAGMSDCETCRGSGAWTAGSLCPNCGGSGRASSNSAADHVCKHVRWHDGREWADCSCGWQSPHVDAIPNSAAECTPRDCCGSPRTCKRPVSLDAARNSAACDWCHGTGQESGSETPYGTQWFDCSQCGGSGHATRNGVEIAAEFLWEAYKRGNYPGMPKWADVNETQKDACRFDARGLLEKVDAT